MRIAIKINDRQLAAHTIGHCRLSQRLLGWVLGAMVTAVLAGAALTVPRLPEFWAMPFAIGCAVCAVQCWRLDRRMQRSHAIFLSHIAVDHELTGRVMVETLLFSNRRPAVTRAASNDD